MLEKMTSSTSLSPDELLFRDSDFDDDNFDDAEFVSKYRRVITLESLREQLVIYSNLVKKDLYSIINRDYKDFITISTKVWLVDCLSDSTFTICFISVVGWFRHTFGNDFQTFI
jgi:hypothetical protein